MTAIFTGLYSTLIFLHTFLTREKKTPAQRGGSFLPPETNASKRAAELFALYYSPCWIVAVGIVIALQSFEQWKEWEYMYFCLACSLPCVLLPLVKPFKADVGTPIAQRYMTKFNLWIAIFSFIGNYWYTHYFYRILRADYTFPAHRLNDVPICLYFMTHAYFVFYHVLSNMALRYVKTAYVPGRARSLFITALVVVMAYTTAFMESLTICGFPYYKFEDVHMAYTVGSAFYAIYFLASFPMFLRVDEDVDKKFTLYQTAAEALAAGMLVLCALDFVRLFMGIPLFVGH